MKKRKGILLPPKPPKPPPVKVHKDKTLYDRKREKQMWRKEVELELLEEENGSS